MTSHREVRLTILRGSVLTAMWSIGSVFRILLLVISLFGAMTVAFAAKVQSDQPSTKWQVDVTMSYIPTSAKGALVAPIKRVPVFSTTVVEGTCFEGVKREELMQRVCITSLPVPGNMMVDGWIFSSAVLTEAEVLEHRDLAPLNVGTSVSVAFNGTWVRTVVGPFTVEIRRVD